MEILKVNETPVRTSRNFNINNIKLENIEIPKETKKFNNVYIENTKNIEIKLNEDEKFNITYGLGEYLNDLVNNKSNYQAKLEINNNGKANAQVKFNFNKQDMNLLEKINIEAKEKSNSTIVLKYESENEDVYFHNGLINVNAKENSKVNIIILNLLNTNSNNFLSIENKIEKQAKVNYCIVDFGGKNSITNYYSNLLGDNSNNIINSIYLGNKDQIFDLNYIGELRGKESNINIEVQGALKDKAKKHFKGTIDFKKGCKRAKGNENENCMLLSDTSRSIALPMLLCSEEDVEGNHSCSAGKIGEKELFYIMSRGFELKDAMKLMVRAKFNKILEEIQDENLKEQILTKIDERLD